jgi:hypothetical protein
MRARSVVLALSAVSILATAEVASATTAVTYKDGLVTIRCKDMPLGQVFDQLKAASGLQVILDGAVRSVRLTAEIDSQPLNFALERLLEGTGVNYAMFLDRGDWQRVAKIYIGSAGAGSAAARGGSPASVSTPMTPRRSTVTRPAADEMEENFEEPEEPDLSEPEPATSEESIVEPQDEGDVDAAPPGSSPNPAPNYLPPPPSFPRSSFTPGLDAQNPFGSTQPATAPQPKNPSGAGTGAGTTTAPGNPPPAYLPFFDAFGRPIPVNPQQQQQPPQGSEQQQKKPQQ